MKCRVCRKPLEDDAVEVQWWHANPQGSADSARPMMRYQEVQAECSQFLAGRKSQISMACAKSIAHYFPSESRSARTFAETGEITEPFEQLWEKFFPKVKRSDAEWAVAKGLYSYLYGRRHRPAAPVTWEKA